MTAKAPERIFDAARIEFGSKGFAQTNVADIAKRAGVSKKLVYHYFIRKEDLYRATVDRLPSSFKALLQADFERDDPQEALDDFVERYVSFYADNEEVGRVFLDQILRSGAELSIGREFQLFKQEMLSKLSDLIRRGVDLGVFRSDIIAAGLLYIATVVSLGYVTMRDILVPLELVIPEIKNNDDVVATARSIVTRTMAASA